MTWEIMKNIILPPAKIPRAPRGKLNDAQQYAKDNNISKYQGNPCKRNHSGLRYTRNGKCVECSYYKPTGRKAGSDPNPFRLAAIQNGEEFYYSGKPCKRGHTSPRPVSSSICLECKAIYMKTVRKKNERKYSLAVYGITVEQYDEMVKAQNGLCKICNKPEIILDGKTGKIKRLAVDHCHDSKKVRGLLCSQCNIGIGNLKHDPVLLRQAALYCEEV